MTNKVIYAEELPAVPRGSRVCLNGREYILVSDARGDNNDIVDLETGARSSWARLVLWNEEVEVTHWRTA